MNLLLFKRKLASLQWLLLEYVFAITITIGTIFLRLSIESYVNNNPTLILFIIPIIFSAYIGGLGPGLVSTAIAAIGGAYFFLFPTYTFSIARPEDKERFIVLIICGVFISVMMGALRRSRSLAQAHEKLLTVTLSSIGDAVIITNIEGQIAFLNAEAEKLMGWTNQEAIGQPLEEVFKIVNEKTRHVVESPTKEVLRSGKIVGLANGAILLSKDGREVPIDDSAAPIKEEDGSIYGVVLIFRDCSEKKKADSELYERLKLKERVAKITMTAPGVLYSFRLRSDGSSCFPYASAGIGDIFGVEPKDLVDDGSIILSLINSEDAKHFRETIEKSKRAMSVWEDEFRIQHPQKGEIWVAGCSMPELEADGSTLWHGFIYDITERKNKEHTLRLWADAFENCAHGIAIGSPTTNRIDVCNLAFAAILGRSIQEITEMPILSIYSPEYHEKIKSCINKADSIGQAQHETSINRKDGSKVYVQVDVVSVFGSNRKLLYRVVTMQDITRRKYAEEKLHYQEALLSEMSQIAKVGGWDFDPGTGEGYWTNEVARIHEVEPSQTSSKSGKDFGLSFYKGESRTRIEDAVKEAIEKGSPYDLELELETAKGNHKWVRTICHPIVENDKVFRVRGSFQDITERKEMENMLKEERALLTQRVEERTTELSFANSQLEKANKLKDEFLASMSHELRTPLNAVLGLSEALQEEIYGTLTEKQRKSLKTIEESGRHLLELINDILDLSKIEAGKLEMQPATISIDSVYQASIRLIKETAHKKQIKVFIMSDNVATTLQADERRLKQILVNLLSNAIKFTPDGGKVGLEIVSEVEKQEVSFTVWDTGIGISKKNLSQLFQPFVQLDSSLARQHSGTGLGLVLVKRMIELLGGRISVESEIDKGSRFTVSLPWDPNNLSITLQEPATNNVFEKINIKRVLVIEDDPVHSEQIVRYLTETGVEVNVYTQGKDTVSIASKLQPDMILLDVLLPDISGWDVLKQLKSETTTKKIPVVIISVVDEQRYGLALDAASFLVKPVSRMQVLGAIKKAISANETDCRTGLEKEKQLPIILLAEDNEINIETISEYLIVKEYKVIVARNGSQAIEMASKEMPDLILMDIQMPGMDGLEATRLIRSNKKLMHIPIVAVTALAMHGDRERCMDAGANAYISKPVKLKELLSLVQNLLPSLSNQ